MQENKPIADMTFCMGYIAKMLSECEKVLPDNEYGKLYKRVSAEESYTAQKEIFSEYVQIIIQKF